MHVLGPTGIDLNASRPLAALFPRVLSLLNRAPSGFKAQYCIFQWAVAVVLLRSLLNLHRQHQRLTGQHMCQCHPEPARR